MKRFHILILCISLFLLSAIPSAALTGKHLTVTLNGKTLYQNQVLLVGGVSYVPFRDFMSVNGLSVSWDGATDTASASTSGVTVRAKKGTSYIEANGRYLYYSKNLIENGTMYVPVRTLMKALGGTVEWNASAMRVDARTGSGTIQNGDSYYNQTDLYWLSRIISAESKGQPMTGKLAVGAVVLNRVRDASYPNLIYDVIFDTKFGVQFTPISNGTIYDEPTEESIIAAKICLEGYLVNDRILYFINPRTASNGWVSQNRAYVMTIADHKFYA